MTSSDDGSSSGTAGSSSVPGSFVGKRRAKKRYGHGNQDSTRDSTTETQETNNTPPEEYSEEDPQVFQKPPQVGAHRVAGIDSPDLEESDDFEIPAEDDPEVEIRSTRSLPPTIEAERVPELVSATAVPHEDDDEDKHACFCCGLKCGTIGKDGKTSHRPLYIAIGVLAIVVVAVAVAVGVTFSKRTLPSTTPPQDAQVGAPSQDTQVEAPASNTTTAPPTPFEPEESMPTMSPTPSPTPLETEELFTTFEYTHLYHGHMFDIVANNDLEVIALQVHMKSTGSEKLEVWTKEGEYHGFETNSSFWTNIGNATVTGQGKNSLTRIPRETFDPVRVNAGARQSFYITAPSKDIIYFQERMNGAGNVSLIEYGDPTEFKNDDLQVNVGTGVEYPFKWHGYPNIFNGAINYLLVEPEEAYPTVEEPEKPYQMKELPDNGG